MKGSFIHPQTQRHVSETEARASHDAGTGYGVLFQWDPGSVKVIVSVRTVWMRFFDDFGRLVWALTWGRNDEGALTLRNFSGTGYSPESQGKAMESELWKAMVMSKSNGRWRIRHSNAETWQSMESEVEMEVPALPYPVFCAFDGYLKCDYSGLEAVALNFPRPLFPSAVPEPPPGIESWIGRIGEDWHPTP